MFITGLYAGLLGVLFLALCYGVILKRLKYKIGIGHGDNHDLHKAIRVQGNFVEYVPFSLFLIAACDVSQMSAPFIHGLGIMLVTGRVMHAYGLYKTSVASKPRVIGIILNHLVIAVGSAALIIQFVTA